MIERLLSLFRSREPRQYRVGVDPDLGPLRYSPAERTWESVGGDDDELYFGGIPGTEEGPSPDHVRFIVERIRTLDKYWTLCEADLREIGKGWDGVPEGLPIRNLFRFAGISLYEDYWEICFKTLPEYKWILVGMQFEGDVLKSNTIDT